MNRSFLHIVAWLAYFFIEVLRYVFLSDFNNPLFTFSRLAVTICTKAALFYLVYSYCAPRYAFTKKWYLLTLSFILSLLVFLFLNSISYYFFQSWFNQGNWNWNYIYLIYFGLDGLVIAAIALLAAFATRHYIQEKQLLKLKKERSQETLRMLQAQVNPHFLFNTLNNIYSLALHNSDKTASAIQQLAAVMRYVFEQSDSSKVPLKDEINTVNNLLEISNLATEEGFSINKLIYYDHDYDIVPLSLVPLIENFIKHGDLSENGFLTLEIHAKNKQLVVKIENAIAQKKQLTNHKTGLDNLRKRLELSYHKNFDLNFSKSESQQTFTLQLNINL